MTRREQESGRGAKHVSVPTSSQSCVKCHQQSSPGIIDHWTGSTHAVKVVGCVECHQAEKNPARASLRSAATKCDLCFNLGAGEARAKDHAAAAVPADAAPVDVSGLPAAISVTTAPSDAVKNDGQAVDSDAATPEKP